MDPAEIPSLGSVARSARIKVQAAPIEKPITPSFRLVQRLGVSVIVTDDRSSYKKVAEALQLEQQICQFHLRRWVGLAVHELKKSLPPEWMAAAEEARQILRDLPIEGDKRRVVLSCQFPPGQ